MNHVAYFSKFDVRSKRFPGHFHTWRLSLFLSKGSERAFETLLCVSYFYVTLAKLIEYIIFIKSLF